MLPYRLFLSLLSVYKRFSALCVVRSRGGSRCMAGGPKATADPAGTGARQGCQGDRGWRIQHEAQDAPQSPGRSGASWGVTRAALKAGLRKEFLCLRGHFFHPGAVSKSQCRNSHVRAVNLSHGFTFPNPSWPSKGLLQSNFMVNKVFASSVLKPCLRRWLPAWQRGCSCSRLPFPGDIQGTAWGGDGMVPLAHPAVHISPFTPETPGFPLDS